MTDILAEMEARRSRVRTPDAPLAAIVAGFAAVMGPPFLMTSLTAAGIADIVGGQSAPAQTLRTVGMVVGLGLAAAVVVWAVLYVALVRRARPSWGLPLLAALVVAGIGASAVAGYVAGSTLDRQRQERIAAIQIREALDLFLTASPDGVIKTNGPKARGAPGEVQQRVQANMREVLTLTRKHKAELTALGIDDVGVRAPTREDLAAWASKSAKAEALIKVHHAAVKSRLLAVRKAMQTELSPWVTRKYLAGYEIELGVRQGMMDRRLTADEQYWDAMERQMLLLRDSWGRWRASRYGIGFQRRSDLDAFDTLAYETRSLKWKSGQLEGEEAVKAAEFEARPAPLD